MESRNSNLKLQRLRARVARTHLPLKPPRKPIRRKITISRMIKAIRDSCGNYSIIAQRLECARITVAIYVNKKGWELARMALDEECERVKDIAENTIEWAMTQRLDFSVASRTAQWYLSRKARERGYGDESKLTLEGGKNPLRVNQVTIPIEALSLPLETRKQLLLAVEEREAQPLTDENNELLIQEHLQREEGEEEEVEEKE